MTLNTPWLQINHINGVKGQKALFLAGISLRVGSFYTGVEKRERNFCDATIKPANVETHTATH